MNKQLIEEIKAVRDTGLANMLDVISVQKIANVLQLDALVEFLDDRANKRVYANFILSGK